MVLVQGKYIVIAIMFFLITGCHPFAVKEHITGNYYLIAVDDQEQLTLSYRVYGDFISRVPAQVKSVKYNDKYIFIERLDKKENTVLFYILDMSKDGKYKETSDCIFGPFSKNVCDSIFNSPG